MKMIKEIDTKYQSKCNPLMARVATSEQGCSGKCKLLLLLNTFRFEEVLYLVCNTERAFMASEEHKDIVYGLVKK